MRKLNSSCTFASELSVGRLLQVSLAPVRNSEKEYFCFRKPVFFISLSGGREFVRPVSLNDVLPGDSRTSVRCLLKLSFRQKAG